jgi:hypothetical protein
MTQKDTGGPAFPTVAGQTVYSNGMTLRDYFAANAPEMPDQWWSDTKAEHGGGAGSWAEAMASWRYFYADAMLAERNK